MSLPLVALLVVAALAAGYVLYGRFLARRLLLDDAVPTPAERLRDGVDYVPTRPFYLLGQHFSAIAAAGPIAGPILACQVFGWVPCALWIGLGVIAIGAVHDFAALVASVRHGARSIAEIVRVNLGPRAWLAILGFIWIALVYVVVAFADITAGTFLRPEGLPGDAPFDPGGAVAASSTMYLLLAVLLGLVNRFLRPPLWLATLLFVPATLGVVWLGTSVSTWLVLGRTEWLVVILGYCFVASVLPVWVLLQPRGYLGGFVLYMALAVGVVGVFLGGYEIRQPGFTSAPLAGLQGSLFPFLFVTIACGACSGFHGLVCSGTTSKQIARETHCRPVGYGAMLLEAFVALIALATVMILAPSEVGKRSPGTVYGDGIASFLTLIVGTDALRFAATFGAMVFSTFIFDTIDVATRLGRYVLQELTGRSGPLAASVATAATVAVPLVVLLTSPAGSFLKFWTLFGTANQLLAALTLLGITVWLRRTGRPCWFTAVPMAFVAAITVWALGAQAYGYLAHPKGTTDVVNGVVALLLGLLAGLLAVEGLRVWRRPAVAPAAA
jgi:carbon starvation protein